MKDRPKVSKLAKVVVIFSAFGLATLLILLALPSMEPPASAPAPSLDPRSANPLDRFCLPDSDLANLAQRDEAQLKALADHFTYCEPDIKAASAARRQVYEHMISRGMASGAYSLAFFHLHGDPDQDKSIAYAQKAVEMGDARGQAIIEEWRTK